MNNALATPGFWYVTVAAYWTVLVAEFVGDKSLYTTTSLALRFRAAIVFGISAVAFATKMLVAVLLGGLLVQWHSRWVDVLSAAAFFISAMLVWYEEPEEGQCRDVGNVPWMRAAGVCLAAFLLTEWADPGQFAAAALAVKSRSLLAPWLGGTLAMVTKSGLALTVGIKLRDLLPRTMLRALASVSCSLLGFLALRGILL
jgi:putative Ca2+/H+ antiporter (TMEM165/GDT1 family)